MTSLPGLVEHGTVVYVCDSCSFTSLSPEEAAAHERTMNKHVKNQWWKHATEPRPVTVKGQVP